MDENKKIKTKTKNEIKPLKRASIKTLEKIEKYTVDVLGEVHKIEKEPRMPFTNKEG